MEMISFGRNLDPRIVTATLLMFMVITPLYLVYSFQLNLLCDDLGPGDFTVSFYLGAFLLSVVGWTGAHILLNTKKRFELLPCEMPLVSPGILCALLVGFSQFDVHRYAGYLKGSDFVLTLGYILIVILLIFDVTLELMARNYRKKDQIN